ncbi:ArsS family sensor histidine kinase [Helicobacter sp. faydin-H20]|uniref:ArsS family sensor histidine kinase n=1 Tax=Helicobacter anatolicus TaxID=2905874 RepID=UPI001E5D606F|nr:ArsS family sensor histidine kinase [Helicobacter anatolicus]MCE3037633.1 ArsS family sensor histidine kinase [Helicobacter anatolicus]
MIKNSIFLKINLLFLFALISFFAFSFYFIQFQKDNEAKISLLKYKQFTATINQIITNNGDLKIVESFLKELDFEITEDPEIKEALLNYNRLPPIFNGIFAKTIQINNKIYILLETQGKATLYTDKLNNHYKTFYLITLVGIIVLVSVFILVIQSLMPLKKLRIQVKKFANGDLNIDCKTLQSDEIGDLANEFDSAIKKIAALGQSRSLFLRSIMHELKTPITKGRISAEMLENSLQKTRLISVFKRLQNLIDEFAKIEQLTSKNLNITKEEFLLEDLINHTKRMLLIDQIENDPIILNDPNDIVKADFELFAMAIKNLLDNAIKYSPDKKVYVDSNHCDIIISNKGEALKKDFHEYFKPYFKDENKANEQHGFGLGMYIIKNTLDALNFKITYFHKEGVNYFTIHDCIVENFCLVPIKNKD